MPVKRAIETYTNTKLNCAQSILTAFKDEMNLHEDSIAEARKSGGGRADGGICGALHAALGLTENQQKKDKIRKTFAEIVGSEKCREIRSAKVTPCAKCVEIAAQLLAAERDC